MIMMTMVDPTRIKQRDGAAESTDRWIKIYATQRKKTDQKCEKGAKPEKNST
jgi:hypothetical protein